MVSMVSPFSARRGPCRATQRLGRLATVQPDGTLQVNGRAAFVVDGIAETDRGPLEMTVSRRTVPESDDGDTEEHRP
ncbi:MAG: hypothetical protein E6I76_13210 [Chloroflexi bacterium]|nr:MAG: hypothetical protein E6I76_13210 [Chloroflexota bacterium]